ncbi:Ribonuclease D [Thalassoglobus neptunius]|uniref:Ribonuclease D n=1 Tax=Thalassoglobus neptunius TaxID=1938619 RepID=A0A5C5WBG4_9PLAN|nr:HRDC domain-containing protein [Thalassoglobus neptunius]TWT47964.1 Ribonuclease D [Thalassoglobus neptunius]
MSLLTSQPEFERLCERIRKAGLVAFDTEFVSESYYRPKLCLLQFAVDDVICAVDPLRVDNLTSWWDIMVDDETTVVVHGGREEIRFCQFATNDRPRKLVDTQIAEGLRSRGYPLSHTNLVSRVLGKNVKHGKETRTDWERRPLLDRQLSYALDDVRYLREIWETQSESLEAVGRLDWALSEFERFVQTIIGEEDRDGWLKLPGYSRLSRRDMGTARDLFLWRDRLAEIENKPPRRVLRDDLLVDVAKRHPKTVKELNMVRDMNRRDYQRHAKDIVDVVNLSLETPDEDLPVSTRNNSYPSQDEVLARILGLALANRCQELGFSMPLVGTSADLKELVRWHVFDKRQGPTPKLFDGWRGDVCGSILIDVLDGNVTLRVADPTSENPLSFDVDR